MSSPASSPAEPFRAWVRRQFGGASRTAAPRAARPRVRSLVRLEDVLYRSPRVYGLDAEAWSVDLLREYLTRELGMPVSEAEVTQRLRAVRRAMDIAAQKAELVPAEGTPSTPMCFFGQSAPFAVPALA